MGPKLVGSALCVVKVDCAPAVSLQHNEEMNK